MAASSLRVAIGPVSDPDGPSSPLLEDSELLAEVAVSQIADHPGATNNSTPGGSKVRT